MPNRLKGLLTKTHWTTSEELIYNLDKQNVYKRADSELESDLAGRTSTQVRDNSGMFLAKARRTI